MVNIVSPVLSLVRIMRLSVSETDIKVAVTPVASVPEFAVLIVDIMSASVSVDEILIPSPFMTNSPVRLSAVVELVKL